MSGTGPPWDNGDQSKIEARRWKAVTLSNRGLTHRMVAEQMQDDYREVNANLTLDQIASAVGVDIHRALKDYQKRADKAIEERIAAQSLRFADIRRRLYAIIAARHYVLYQGAIVEGMDGDPLEDDGPRIAALAQLQQLEDRQARLEGTYQREKLDIALSRRVEEEATDVVEAILAGANAINLEPAQRQRMLEAAGAHLRIIEGEVVSEEES